MRNEINYGELVAVLDKAFPNADVEFPIAAASSEPMSAAVAIALAIESLCTDPVDHPGLKGIDRRGLSPLPTM